MQTSLPTPIVIDANLAVWVVLPMIAAEEVALAELWTADKRLCNGAKQTGVTWVHWIGE